MHPWRELVHGIDDDAPEGARDYINFDNAATTPPFVAVTRRIQEVVPWYASIHRGTGIKSRVATRLYEGARESVLEFFGAPQDEFGVVFVKHTTEALNLFAWVAGREGMRVITSVHEHHSNLLPWRRLPGTVVLEAAPDGGHDLDALESALREHPGPATVVAVTAASNVTGALTPLEAISSLTRRHGARLLVDAAQIAAHRRLHMRSPGLAVDVLAVSGHKLYAPFGVGALVAPLKLLDAADPWLVGGGVADLVTDDAVLFARGPHRHEAGSPNLLGAVALAAALEELQRLGLDAVEAHERTLTRRALDALGAMNGVRLLGPAPKREDRLGIVPMAVEGFAQNLVAAALAREWNIGVRSGCFCAHPYVTRLLRLAGAPAPTTVARGEGRTCWMPDGVVRASFGLYNTEAEVDRLVTALGEIQREGPRMRYRVVGSGYHTDDEEAWVASHLPGRPGAARIPTDADPEE